MLGPLVTGTTRPLAAVIAPTRPLFIRPHLEFSRSGIISTIAKGTIAQPEDKHHISRRRRSSSPFPFFFFLKLPKSNLCNSTAPEHLFVEPITAETLYIAFYTYSAYVNFVVYDYLSHMTRCIDSETPNTLALALLLLLQNDYLFTYHLYHLHLQVPTCRTKVCD